jgi:tetratricopeptide (TPR) repeat protein
MRTACLVALLIGFQASSPAERLIAARARAYDANFQNDAAGLRAAIAEFETLIDDRTVGRMARYYASWTEWALAMSEMQAGRTPEAIVATERSVAHSRKALEHDGSDPEVLTMLVNGLIAAALMNPPPRQELITEFMDVRRKAVALAPENPRVVIMDAGIIFNAPPDFGGDKDKGLARWKQALELFELEARAATKDPLAPDWGRALAHGWMSQLYLRMTPPQYEHAHEAAKTALTLRPDFWYVKDQVLPRLPK